MRAILFALTLVLGCAPRGAHAPRACPEGTHDEGSRCVADVDKSCPPGLQFEEGKGCLAAVTATPAPTETATAPAPTVALHWVGEWVGVGGGGVKFGFDIQLTPKGDALAGRIRWKLLSVPAGHFLTNRVGDSANEFVQGSWSASTRELHLVGTSVDDNTLLATDEYKLIVSSDGTVFDGRTKGNAGDWMNEIHGRRAD